MLSLESGAQQHRELLGTAPTGRHLWLLERRAAACPMARALALAALALACAASSAGTEPSCSAGGAGSNESRCAAAAAAAGSRAINDFAMESFADGIPVNVQLVSDTC